MSNQKKNELQVMKKELSDHVEQRIGELQKAGRLDLPQDYSVGNAMSSAWLILQETQDRNKKPVLQSCSKNSIANALLQMAILGLNPAKDQCYFIAYGTRLTLFPSYFGKITAVSRLKGFEELPVARLIYDGDEVEIGVNESGDEAVLSHSTSWDNKLKGNITGAYAILKFAGQVRSTVMTMDEIKEAWSMSQANKHHDKFTGEFAKRTVLNRLLKMVLKTSTDQDVIGETIVQTEKEHYDFDGDVIEDQQQVIEENTASEDAPDDDYDEETGEFKDDTPPDNLFEDASKDSKKKDSKKQSEPSF